jgi:hypothetical protein
VAGRAAMDFSAVDASGAIGVAVPTTLGSFPTSGGGSGYYREIDYASDGKPTQDVASSSVPDAGGHESTVTAVLYQDRQWARDISWSAATGGQLAQDACGVIPSFGLAGLSYSADPAIAGTLLSCPAVTVTRGVKVDGIGAIELTARKLGGTLWINAATDLPIKSVLPGTVGWVQTTPPGDKETKAITTSFGYLAPVSSNLAYLSAVIPAGFHGSTQRSGQLPTGKYIPPWVPPANVIPPFGLQPVPASDGLTPAQAARDVLWARTTTQGTPASDTLVDSAFDYRSASRDLTYTPAGQPWDDDNTYVKSGTAGKSVSVHTVVLYDKRTVSVQTSPAVAQSQAPQDACSTAQRTGLAAISFATAPDAARALLDCPGQEVTRGVTLDGVDAIKIAGGHGETLWINATTDLPIEIVIVDSKPYPPAAYNSAPSPGQVIQYTWLPPTSTSLSYLGIPTPASFARSQSPGSAQALGSTS